MQANYVQRLRLTFGKTGPTRFIGHLDLARALERTLNRAQIPVAYSQGFNRRPRMQLAAALPLGYTSDFEMADIWLTESRSPQDVRQRIEAKIAPGLNIFQVAEVPLAQAPLQTQTVSSLYTARLLDPVDPGQLRQHVQALLAETTLIRQRSRGRKRNSFDLRPQIIDLQVKESADGARLAMQLYLMPGKTGRPDEVLLALGLDPLAARIHRTQILLDQGETSDIVPTSELAAS